MGGVDKALLPLAGQSLIARVAARFEPQVERLAVSGRQGYLGLPALADDGSFGPLSGVLAALRWAGTAGADAVVTVPVDGPFVPGDLVPRLLLAGDGGRGLLGVALAQSGGRAHPTFALWPVGVAAALEAFLASGAKARVLDFARSQGAVMAEFPDDGSFVNLNTPQDLAQAEAASGAAP
jgi:molybdopterin-guanine dinucleotide biosynthesis protein A